ncbi:hypothetical protein [Streptomyces sp. NPDC002845]
MFRGAKALCASFISVTLTLGLCTPAVAADSADSTAPPRGWVGTWESPAAVGASTDELAPGDSVRQVVPVGVGGPRVRVRLSHEFGTAPLPLGRVTVAVRGDHLHPNDAGCEAMAAAVDLTTL